MSEHIRLSGCEILPDGKIVLVNGSDKSILMYNKSGSPIKEFQLQWEPFDITYIDNDMIAISFMYGKKVCRFNTTNEQLDTIYESSNAILGISFKDGNIYLRQCNEGIIIITVSGTLISILKLDSETTSNLCVGKSGKIYYPIRNKSSVTCCDNKGNIQWTATHDSLKEVYGITCGLNDVVFAADNDGGITLISSDGQQIKRILDKSSGVDRPNCIHFSHKRNQLLVCNGHAGHVFLYDVQ